MSTNATNNCTTVKDPYENIKIASTLLVSGLAVIANIFIVVLAAKYTPRKNLHHLIINMAIADALAAVMTALQIVPPLLNFNIFDVESDELGASMCKLLALLLDSSRLVSLNSLFIISFERYRATKVTAHRSRQYTNKKRIAVIAASWIVAMIVSSYVLVFAKTKSKECWFPFTALPWFGVHHSYTAITFCLTCILSFLSLQRLAKPSSILSHLSKDQRDARTKKTKKVIKMVLWSMIFYSSNLPFMIFKVLELFTLSGINIIILRPCDISFVECVLRFLTLFNSCLSPCIYIVFLTDFRQGAMKLLRAWKMRPIKQSKDGARAENKFRNLAGEVNGGSVIDEEENMTTYL